MSMRLLLEPAARNTAPAICAAALFSQRTAGDTPLLVLAADHVIGDEAAFASAVQSGAELAEAGHLVTFAVPPRHAATAYGYLKPGAAIDAGKRQYRIDAFQEKPDSRTASRFLSEGGYFWNSGMVMVRPSVVLAAFARLEPGILDACRQALAGATPDLPAVGLAPDGFLRAPSVSFARAILERAGNVAAVLADFDWSDAGDWSAIWALSARDRSGNALRGSAHMLDCERSLLIGEVLLLVGVGLADMVCIATPDAVLVAPRSRAQDVKLAVARLDAASGREAATGHRVGRPWGAFAQLHEGPGFRVKELAVVPGGKLSLQRHRHRGEHWVCVAGVGEALVGTEWLALAPGTAVSIPQGTTHRLENRGGDLLRVIETQFGAYTGEDDIERIEDIYGRV